MGLRDTVDLRAQISIRESILERGSICVIERSSGLLPAKGSIARLNAFSRSRFRITKAVWLLPVLLVLILTCSREQTPPNVVIIAVDTLRPDHLGCYGYGRDTSPAIDALAGRSTLFENAISQSPWTLPSFGSIFTSLYPSQHGAMSAVSRMRESFPTLGEILMERGYATGAIVNASVLKPEYGINRGFEFYDPTPLEGRVADGTTRDALQWVDDNSDRPFLLFAHYFDPHEPYSPPAAYAARYKGDYDGPIGDTFVLHDHCPDVLGMAFEGLKRLSAADWNQVRALYDGEIAFADSQIGILLEGLDERGLLSNTLVVFLSDHGEEFYEHKGFGHGHVLYDEVIHVPLMLSLPGRIPEGVRIGRQVRLIDVMPTILDYIGIKASVHMEGVSLKPLLAGTGGGTSAGSGTVEGTGGNGGGTGSPGRISAGQLSASRAAILPADAAYSEGLLHGPERKSVSRQAWKLIYDLSTREAAVFDREEDPAELLDMVSEEPDALGPLNGLLVKTLLRTHPTWFVEIAGEGEVFDLKVRTDTGSGTGHVQMAVSLDQAGAPAGVLKGLEIESSCIRLSASPDPARPVVLAFHLDGPPRLPVEFEVMIDGKDGGGHTFVGDPLESPGTMPFALELRGTDARSKSSPRPRPPTPYVLVWHTSPQFRGRTAMKLDESTRQELKALGYIQ